LSWLFRRLGAHRPSVDGFKPHSLWNPSASRPPAGVSSQERSLDRLPAVRRHSVDAIGAYFVPVRGSLRRVPFQYTILTIDTRRTHFETKTTGATLKAIFSVPRDRSALLITCSITLSWFRYACPLRPVLVRSRPDQSPSRGWESAPGGRSGSMTSLRVASPIRTAGGQRFVFRNGQGRRLIGESLDLMPYLLDA
jgi:hypothetical protein